MSTVNSEDQLRFGFGRNWRRFAQVINERRITTAAESLSTMLASQTLKGRSFLDAGCGSGLFSLAAARAGASRVISFDYDADSVTAATQVKARFMPGAGQWNITKGDVLDRQFMEGLGTFDVVYSWGVLHHTGNMWKAFENISICCASGGRLFIAIYNDQGIFSVMWKIVKRAYNLLPGPLKYLILLPAFAYLWGPSFVKDALRLHPFRRWRARTLSRGMSPWHDVIDWVGGYPFEVASREKVIACFEEKGFKLERMISCGNGHGNNEFVFIKNA